jgi:hypothetical protein
MSKKEVVTNAKPCENYTQSYSRSYEINKVTSEDYKCRNCSWFGLSGYERQEKLLNAEPCQNFRAK